MQGGEAEALIERVVLGLAHRLALLDPGWLASFVLERGMPRSRHRRRLRRLGHRPVGGDDEGIDIIVPTRARRVGLSPTDGGAK